MKIFNSLGSNYNLQFVLASLFSFPSDDSKAKLIKKLEEKYDGKAVLLYKGREAIRLALEILKFPKDSVVAINGFTCFAVYKAVEEANCKAEFLDIEDRDLNFSVDELLNKIKQNPKIKAVIVQNTLGDPCDIEKIEKVCRENNIVLIEDLAHCVGSIYKNGKEAGTVGDFVILSFSQDKIIDAVSGGALIIRNKKYNNLTIGQFSNVSIKQQLKDRLYPHLTFKIRVMYSLGIGKIIHFISKKLNLLSKPMQEGLYAKYNLPNWYCNLALLGFKNLKKNLEHRRKIANLYKNLLDKKVLSETLINRIDLSSNLRFSVFVENRGSLIKYFKNNDIYVADVWYDSVAPTCPNAQTTSQRILNLPTHINVSEKDARKISQKINLWLKSQ